MQIPFGQFGRRPGAPDLDEALEGGPVDAVDAPERPSDEPKLALQRMENRLVRYDLVAPKVLSSEDLRRLRYVLNFARLADFEPGAAGPRGSRGRSDVSVGAEIAPWRAKVSDALRGPLREERDPVTALTAARDVLAGLVDDQDEQRRLLLDGHRNDFSPAELDAEVGYKKLVGVLGGGGGGGFVDCFHPQWDPKHLWLVPITQAIQLQMVRNAPYADHLVRFEPTLSPVNLAPSVAAIDRACGWGATSVEKAIPVISALLEPTWCEGDGPAVPGEEPEARGKSVASPMSAVMAAIQLPQNRFTRWRRRHLT